MPVLRLCCYNNFHKPRRGPQELATELVYADNEIRVPTAGGQDRVLGHFVAVGHGAVIHVDGLEAGCVRCRDHDRG